MAVATNYAIPFNKPCFVGHELQYIAEAIESGHVSGDGGFSIRCHALLERELGVKRALLTPSGTHALEMAALLLDIKPGDEVVVPSFTFVSTINAFVLRGATPVFADIRPDTLNLDERHVDRLMTDRTKAVVPVHYGGVGCEMDAIGAAAARHGAAVVEDAAHALFATYRGRSLGSFGRFAALSFHETKNVICGEGGALLLNDERDIERAEILREKGTNRTRFARGEVDRYTWVDIGSSYLLSDILAAFLYAQLEAKDRILTERRRIVQEYATQLAAWAKANGAQLPVVPAHCEPSYHLFYLLMPSRQARTALIDHLKRRGILSVFHYLPLHLSPMGRRWGYGAGACPVTEDVSERLVRLPCYYSLTPDEQAQVIDAVQEVSVG